jgi:hypothetical protein
MVKRVGLLVACLLLALLPCAASADHQYRFEVPSMSIDLTPQHDGSMMIQYVIRFKNLSPDPLDIVDIGVPHEGYDVSTFAAAIDGHGLGSIRPSSYVKPGVEVALTRHEIATGETGVFKISFVMPKMVFYDKDDANYTSVEFGNTYFGSDFTSGAMRLKVSYHFPAGVTGNETKWHGQQPTSMDTKSDHLIFTWVVEDASPSQMYKFGIGFPTRYVDRNAIQKYSALADLGTQCLGLIGSALPVVLPIGIFMIPIILGLITTRIRRKRYLPPSLGIEGAGVKRGLTAPEAAALMELPPDRVLTMILFGLIKKQAVRVTQDKPVLLEKIDPAPAGLYAYETAFLGAIKADHKLDEAGLRAMFVALVKSVNNKIKGFSRKETRDYYQTVMKVAWEDVKKAATPEIGNVFADRAEWLLLDHGYADHTRDIFHDRDVVIMPQWWGYGYGWSGGSSGSFSIPGASFAHDFTTRLSNFSSTAVNNVSSFTASITNITNPPPVSSGGGGGHGGACACACAGCACACAGGGR